MNVRRTEVRLMTCKGPEPKRGETLHLILSYKKYPNNPNLLNSGHFPKLVTDWLSYVSYLRPVVVVVKLFVLKVIDGL